MAALAQVLQNLRAIGVAARKAFPARPDPLSKLRINLLREWSQRVLWQVLLLLAAAGCSTLQHPLAPVNLSEPGWTVRQGQAIWKLPDGRPDIAGELILATGPEGKAFVQFSKSPFALVIGQLNAHGWQVEFPPQNKRYAGPGTPPKRLIWLYLPRVLAGQSPPKGWSWSESDGEFRLQNPANGEAIEGFFAQ